MNVIEKFARFFFFAIPLVILATVSGGARAEGIPNIGVAVTGGLSGFGGDIGVGINNYLSVRGSFATFSISRSGGSYGTSVSWDASLKLTQTGLLLDMYPFAGGFHVTAGAVRDGNKFSLTGKPGAGSSYTFNGHTYPAADIGSASGEVEWGKTVPYLGVGWGNLGGSKGFHLTSDLGVLFTGSPTVNLTVNCATGFTGCSTLQTDAAAEQAKLQNDVHKLSFWPVLRVGVGWTF